MSRRRRVPNGFLLAGGAGDGCRPDCWAGGFHASARDAVFQATASLGSKGKEVAGSMGAGQSNDGLSQLVEFELAVSGCDQNSWDPGIPFLFNASTPHGGMNSTMRGETKSLTENDVETLGPWGVTRCAR